MAQVRGLWALSCSDGAAWFAGATRSTTQPLTAGAVLTGISPEAASCFLASCAMPPRLCIEADADGARVTDCDTGDPADRLAWSEVDPQPRQPLIVGDRAIAVIVEAPEAVGSGAGGAGPATATPAYGATMPATAPATAWAAAPPRPAPSAVPVSPPVAPPVSPTVAVASANGWSTSPAPAAAPVAPAPVRPAAAPVPAPAPVTSVQTSAGGRVQLVTTTYEDSPAAPTPAPSTPAAPARGGSPRLPTELALAFALPAAPPTPCVPTASLRAPSAEQSDLGDEAAISGDYVTAMDRWRAAVTINACNGVAWTSMGSALLDGGAWTKAEEALAVAVRLQPGNVRAWAELGRAREKLGRYPDAISAYQEALTVQGDYLPAEEGLQRAVRQSR